jgi:hypothetical protein
VTLKAMNYNNPNNQLTTPSIKDDLFNVLNAYLLKEM